jgi:hypothetical protein
LPTPVSKILTHSGEKQALNVLQTFTSQPVLKEIDDQMRASEIIKLQKFLATQSATNPPSNKKFDPAKINTAIDDQLIGAKIIELQNAANLT